MVIMEEAGDRMTELKRIGNIYGENVGTGHAGNVWDKNGLAPTLISTEGGNKQPMIIDDVEIKPECINLYDEEGKETSFQDRIYKTDKTSPAITTSFRPSYEIEKYRIRKLTPKECWRLMGFSDEDFEKAAKVNSNTQLYKQAGNSIVQDVLMAIFRQMFD